MEKQEYSIIEQQIDKSARLLMYTDGINEAFNSVLEQYDGRRLLEFLAQSGAVTATQTGEATLEDVGRCVKDAKQSDDITLLIFQYGE